MCDEVSWVRRWRIFWMICRKERGRGARRSAVLAELDEHISEEERTWPGGGEGQYGLVHDVEIDRDDLSHLQPPRTRTRTRTRMTMIQVQKQILPVKDHAEVRQNRKVHRKQVRAIPSLNPIKSRYQLASACLSITLHSKIINPSWFELHFLSTLICTIIISLQIVEGIHTEGMPNYSQALHLDAPPTQSQKVKTYRISGCKLSFKQSNFWWFLKCFFRYNPVVEKWDVTMTQANNESLEVQGYGSPRREARGTSPGRS